MFLAHVSDLRLNYSTPLPQFQNKKFLINNGQYQIGSNVCPHQASRIISATTQELRCQYHGWSWDNTGLPVGNGYTSVCNKKKLSLTDAYNYKGLLFDQPYNIPEVKHLPLDNFSLVERRIDTVQADARIIMDVFLDVDHIPLVHENVYDAIDIAGAADVTWGYFNNGSLQRVTPTGGGPELAALWLAVYPYTMIEWQPGAMFITVCVPTSDTSTDVVVWKYKDNKSDSDTWQLNSTIWETAWTQDKVQSEAIVVYGKGLAEQPKKHFNDYLKKTKV